MVQRTTSATVTRKLARPKRRDIFFHLIKTGKLIGALGTDRRISIVRKFLFFGMVIGLLAILLFPDAFGEVVMSVILPLVGTVLGVPLDAGFDWVTFAIVVVSLLHLFPAEIVSEHYQAIFQKA